MPEQGTWRISTAYEYVNDLDAPDLAWEFLRRNPEYQQDYKRLKGHGLDEDKAEVALANKWGLSFRCRPRSPGNGCKTRVDTSSRSVDADPAAPPAVDCACTGG